MDEITKMEQALADAKAASEAKAAKRPFPYDPKLPGNAPMGLLQMLGDVPEGEHDFEVSKMIRSKKNTMDMLVCQSQTGKSFLLTIANARHYSGQDEMKGTGTLKKKGNHISVVFYG